MSKEATYDHYPKPTMSTPKIPITDIFKCSFGQTIKLMTTNYHTWKSDIEIILERESLLEIVLGNEAPLPDGNSRAAIEATDQYQARIKKAYSIVAGSCSITVRDFFKGIRDPAAIWTTLNEKLNTASSEARQLALAYPF
jgi:hypothetical protein